MLQGTNFSIPLVSHCSFQQLCPCRVKGCSCRSCCEAGWDHLGSTFPPCSSRSSGDGGKREEVMLQLLSPWSVKGCKDRWRQGARERTKVLACGGCLSPLNVPFAKDSSCSEPMAALKGTHRTYLFGRGRGRGEDRSQCIYYPPRQKQQAVNYWTVAHTAVAHTAHTGNCCLKRVSRMIFLWLLVCLY